MDIEKAAVPMPNSQRQAFGNVLPPVPVVIVGSHYDQIPLERQQETITKVQSLIDEVKVRYVSCLFYESQHSGYFCKI